MYIALSNNRNNRESEVIDMSISISSVSNDMYNASLTKKVADDPAGAAIAQKHLSQVNGYNQGVRNGEDGQGVIRTADGALASITESLQRMRELSLKASNSIYTSDDKQGIQKEIDQLKEHITSVAKNTQFNTKKLLDGSMADMHLALNPEGGGLSIRTTDATLEALGIKDYSVTGKFDISKLDDAISKVNDARASLGAQSSAIEFSTSVGRISSENMTSSQSSLEDLDVEQYVSEKKKNDIMQQYQYFVIDQKMTQQEDMVTKLLGV